MYIYAAIGADSKIVEEFYVYDIPYDGDETAFRIPVDAVDESWIGRKRWNAEAQVWEDVQPNEAITKNSLEFTHIDANGTKHWLDGYINDLAEDVANAGNIDTSAFAPINHTHSGYAASNHNHNSSYISKDMQIVADNGGALISINRDEGRNVLDVIAALPAGVHTVYAQSGTDGSPKSTEAWRYLVHKTGTATGWVQGYGSVGSVYTNYQDGVSTGWRGWRCIWDNDPNPLWSGQYYMSSPNSTPQTVTPSKKLSECRTGWLLLWSDYDPGAGSNDADFVTTMIPKNDPSGNKWAGKSFLCDIPRYVGSNTDDVDTERRIIKPIYVHDNRIEGSYQNDKDERNDVVLRAVYEF